MRFSCREEFKKAVETSSIRDKRAIIFKKNDNRRVQVKCKDPTCGWYMFSSRRSGECGMQLTRYEPKHTCNMVFMNKTLSSTWLAKAYEHRFKFHPKIKPSEFRNEMLVKLSQHVSKWQACRAKSKALTSIYGDEDEQFKGIWDYCAEVARTNPRTTCIVKTIDTENGMKRFHRIYICWAACREGFKSACRKIIGVDGCHLKGKYGGQLLTAVGIDANNNIYPLAYAVVEVENKSSWEWFLEYLYRDVKHSDDIQEQYTWTFMSDKQKGLIEAFKTVLPYVDHRFCVRHLHGNFKRAGFNAQAFKDVLWLAATSTTIQYFNYHMEKMKKLDIKAFDWLKDKCPTTWSRAYFSSGVKCDILLNNLCECFNAFILDARDKPILTLLLMIKDLIMVRMQRNRSSAEAWEGKICPKIRKRLRKNVDESIGYIPVKSDKYHFQVYTGSYELQCAVDLIKRTCTCYRWQLTGIPCKHACCAIRMDLGDDIEDYVHSSYSVETYRRSYSPVIMPMAGREFWPRDARLLLPPIYNGKKLGRPKRMRRIDPHEVQQDQGQEAGRRLAIKKRKQFCAKCRGEGHNARSCKVQYEVQVPVREPFVQGESDGPYGRLLSSVSTICFESQNSNLEN